jgi:hypothetical protein
MTQEDIDTAGTKLYRRTAIKADLSLPQQPRGGSGASDEIWRTNYRGELVLTPAGREALRKALHAKHVHWVFWAALTVQILDSLVQLVSEYKGQ